MNEQTKAIVNEAVESMQDSFSTYLWKTVGRKIMHVVSSDSNLRENMLMAGAMQVLASQSNPESAHGKLARQLALGMNLNVMDDLFSRGRDAIAEIPMLEGHAMREYELNETFNNASSSLEEASKDETKFCATQSTQNVQSIPLPAANSVSPKNAVVISKPAAGEQVKSSTNPNRPACPKCGKQFKTSKLRKVIFKNPEAMPEDIKDYHSKMLCGDCHKAVMTKARSVEAELAQQAAKTKEKLEARDNLVKTQESLDAEKAKLPNLNKALEQVKSLSPDACKSIEEKIAEVNKCISTLTEQKIRLEKVIAG